jgi:Fur family transcriptional regulator, peroxide stress response regulator
MNGSSSNLSDSPVSARLAMRGLRLTPQRQHVYEVLVGVRDHPTAEEVFLRAKQGMPEISMATVYNCLDALVQCGLAKQVNVDRSASRFCPNMSEHNHFYCERCGGIYDIENGAGAVGRGIKLPRGFEVMHVDVSLRGVCGSCNDAEKV